MEEDLIEVLDESAPSLKEILTELFVSNGIGLQALVTVSLVGVLFAAWKAPKWVRKIGLAAPVVCIMVFMLRVIQTCTDCLTAGSISQTCIVDGARIFIMTLIYGLMIYLIALIIDLVQTSNSSALKGMVKACGHIVLILSIIYFLSVTLGIIDILIVKSDNRQMEIAGVLLPAARILFIGLTIYLISVILRIIQNPRI